MAESEKTTLSRSAVLIFNFPGKTASSQCHHTERAPAVGWACFLELSLPPEGVFDTWVAFPGGTCGCWPSKMGETGPRQTPPLSGFSSAILRLPTERNRSSEPASLVSPAPGSGVTPPPPSPLSHSLETRMTHRKDEGFCKQTTKVQPPRAQNGA